MKMPEIYLASSALPDYNLAATAQTTLKFGFAGCQLYLNPSTADRDYFTRLIELLKNSGLPSILHLPDSYTPEQLKEAETLAGLHPLSRILWHLPADHNQPLPAAITLLENSVFGCRADYYNQLFNRAEKSGCHLALDLPRLFDGSCPPDFTRNFALSLYNRLTPGAILHLIDFKTTSLDRAGWCTLGQGELGFLLPALRNFPGVIVLEYENLKQAVETLSLFKH